MSKLIEIIPKLPTSWDEVTVAQWQRVELIRKATQVGYMPGEQYLLLATELLDMRPEQVAKLPIADDVAALSFLATPPDVKPVHTFSLAGDTHLVDTDTIQYTCGERFRDQPLGRLVTLDALGQLTAAAAERVAANDLSALPKLVAVLVVQTDDWEGKSTFKEVLDLERQFQHLPVTIALGVYAFFLRSCKRYQSGIRRSMRLAMALRRMKRRFTRSMAGATRFIRTLNVSA